MTPLTFLWRATPSHSPMGATCVPIDPSVVFPGGRRAVTHGFQAIGMTRSSRIAYPEWSSHCVLSAIARCASPVPLTEVLRHGITVQAVLLYEQWGWPFPESARSQILERFRGTAILLDRVDSGDFLNQRPLPASYEIASLSKLLGLPGGGLCRERGVYVSFRPEPASSFARFLATPETGRFEEAAECREYLKDSNQVVHREVGEWVAHNCLACALENERAARQRNLELLLDSPLASSWPLWMKETVALGAAPGIAPVLEGQSAATLETAMTELATRCRVQGALYRFDWSGNPVAPLYRLCLAVPVHGEVVNMSEIIKTLSPLCRG